MDTDAQHDCGGSIQHHCSHCNQYGSPVSFHLPTIIHSVALASLQNNEIPLDNPFTIQDWLNLVIATQTDDLNPENVCHTCPPSFKGTDIIFEHLPYLYFDVPQEMASRVLPSKELTFLTTNSVRDRYQLRGIIYHGQLHFTAHLITEDNMVWGYYGQHNMGVPSKDQMVMTNIHDLVSFQGR